MRLPSIPVSALSALILAVGTFAPAVAKADSAVISFSGTIFDTYNFNAFPVGTPYQGTAVYNLDDSVTKSTAGGLSFETPLTGASEGVSITVDGYTFSETESKSGSASFFQINSKRSAFEIGGVGDKTSPLGGPEIWDVDLQLVGLSGLVALDPRMPRSFDWSDLQTSDNQPGPITAGTVCFNDGTECGSWFAGNILSISFQIVPEPSSKAMLILGILGLCILGYARFHKAVPRGGSPAILAGSSMTRLKVPSSY